MNILALLYFCVRQLLTSHIKSIRSLCRKAQRVRDNWTS